MSLFPISGHRAPCLAVLGAGYWGRNLIRNFYQLGGLAVIVDTRRDVLAQCQLDYPMVECLEDVQALWNQPQVSAVAIATPSQTHFELARQALLAGKHVYVEKPLTTSTPQAHELAQLARERNLILMVGHLLVYHPVVTRLKQLIDSGLLGTIAYIHSDRLNWNHGRADVNVLWDLAPHDLSMMVYLLGRAPVALQTTIGIRSYSLDGKLDDVTMAYDFGQGVRGSIHTSWVYPKKQVQLIIKGSDASAIFDDTLPGDRKLQVFHHAQPGQWEVEALETLPLEPLKLECQHFLNAVRDGLPVQTDIQSAMAVIEWLEKADHQLANL